MQIYYFCSSSELMVYLSSFAGLESCVHGVHCTIFTAKCGAIFAFCKWKTQSTLQKLIVSSHLCSRCLDLQFPGTSARERVFNNQRPLPLTPTPLHPYRSSFFCLFVCLFVYPSSQHPSHLPSSAHTNSDASWVDLTFQHNRAPSSLTAAHPTHLSSS